jgi:hypothetical protein
MSDERSTPERREPRNPGKRASDSTEAHLPAKDLIPLLKGWDYEPGTINVRKIFGMDGQPKVQMRLELGILQMEISGRPDGARPHGHESLLDYLETQLKEHKKRHGSDLGFHLTGAQCQSLREEAQLYYQRYLSLFVLEDFNGVVRDTERNLRVLDFCGKFAVEEQDRLMLEQFRPYIVMMNAKAAASISFKAEKYPEALSIITDALDNIREFFTSLGQPDAFSQSGEVRMLRRFARDIRRKMPVDPMQKLQNQLERAVKSERYEDAAKLRDEIKRKANAQHGA